jgi:hypothetical protein
LCDSRVHLRVYNFLDLIFDAISAPGAIVCIILLVFLFAFDKMLPDVRGIRHSSDERPVLSVQLVVIRRGSI